MSLFLAHLLNGMAFGLSREMELQPHDILLNAKASCRAGHQPCSVCTPGDMYLSADLHFLEEERDEKLSKAYLEDKKRRLRAGWQWS